MKKKIINFLEQNRKIPLPEDALFHVIPAPYEKSVSYGKGTRRGPKAILEASSQIELFDGISVPYDKGIYTYPFLSCSGDHKSAIREIRKTVKKTIKMGKIPVMLGGEHTATLGPVSAFCEEYGDSFAVIQFDAHADLRDKYRRGAEYSHACVMRRIYQDYKLKIFQIGVRSMSLECNQYRKSENIPYLDALSIAKSETLKDEFLPGDFPQKVYVTIDVDGLDPSVIPATGTPEPGGLSWYQMLDILESITKIRKVVGFDVVELAPIKGLHFANYAIARLVYNFIGMIARNQH